MPEVRRYRVTEVRDVYVTAESPATAVEKAKNIFGGKEDPTKFSTRVTTTEIHAVPAR